MSTLSNALRVGAVGMLLRLAVSAPAQVTEYASVDSAEVQLPGDGGLHTRVAISGDGNFVAFCQGAFPGGFADGDVLVRDRRFPGTTTKVSPAAHDGGPDCLRPDISGDGRVVSWIFLGDGFAYASAWQSPGMPFEPISLPDGAYVPGVTVPVGAAFAALSHDGRYVAFSTPTDLTGMGGNGVMDVYLRDRVLGTTVLCSRTPLGLEGGGASGNFVGPSISSDGKYVVFESAAGDLLAAGPPLAAGINVYRFSRDTLGVELVSKTADGLCAGNDWSGEYGHDVSYDGTWVAFHSFATNLQSSAAAGCVGGGPFGQVWCKNMASGAIELISVDSTGAPGEGKMPRINKSPGGGALDGQFVAFISAVPLVPEAVGGAHPQVYRRDRINDVTEYVTIAADGTFGNFNCETSAMPNEAVLWAYPDISSLGNAVAFYGKPTNLVAGWVDTNGFGHDVFVRTITQAGACCVPVSGACSVVTQADCVNMGGFFAGNAVACNPCPTPAPAVARGDLVLGTYVNGPGGVELVRAGIRIGSWTLARFLQSVEFDNRDGAHSHSPRGNLLALDFGVGGAAAGTPPACGDPTRPQEGGGLFNLSTDGSDRVQLLYRFNGLVNAGAPCTRVGGLSVSPDNSKLAVLGYDTGSLYVFIYAAGATPGQGIGAAATLRTEFPLFAATAATQGTTWLDNTHVVAAIAGAGGMVIVKSLDITNGATFTIASFAGRGTSSRFTDIEYNPTIAPYVFVQQSAFTAGVSTTTVTVVDRNTGMVLKTVILDVSCQTGRELALGPDRKLYIGQFAGSTAPIPRVYVDVLNLDADGDMDIDGADIAALGANSSVDYFTPASGAIQSFTGIDVAVRGCAGYRRGDANGDGAVNNFDIDPFVLALTNLSAYMAQYCLGDQSCVVCRIDINRDGTVNNFDIDPFVDCVVSNGCP